MNSRTAKLIYLVCIHLLLVGILIKPGAVVKLKAAVNPPKAEEIGGNFKTMTEYHRRMDLNTPYGSVVFIGDSFIQGLNQTFAACPSVNYGIGRDTTAGVLQRLPEYKSLNERAKAVVLHIGVNDMLYRDNAEIIENYKEILKAIPAKLPVLVSALFLVIGDHGKVTNERIKDLNSELGKLCKENSPRCRFLNIERELLTDGKPDPTLFDADGIHLNTRGNQVWLDWLREEIRLLLEGQKPVVAPPAKASETPALK